MHEQDLEAAWVKYESLGGDQLLVSSGYNQLPGGIYKRLEVAIHLSDELRRARAQRDMRVLWPRVISEGPREKGFRLRSLCEHPLHH